MIISTENMTKVGKSSQTKLQNQSHGHPDGIGVNAGIAGGLPGCLVADALQPPPTDEIPHILSSTAISLFLQPSKSISCLLLSDERDGAF
ncbi:hypothetical protein V2J09_023878 [Rumex salicifolius]